MQSYFTTVRQAALQPRFVDWVCLLFGGAGCGAFVAAFAREFLKF